MKRNNFDIFHPTYYNAYLIKHLKKPLVPLNMILLMNDYPNIIV